MDGRHVHNKQPPTPSAHFTFVKWAAPLWRWMGRREARGYLAEKPATWTFRLRVPRFQGLRPSARHGSRSRPAGLMVGIKQILFTGTFGFGKWKWEDQHLYFKGLQKVQLILHPDALARHLLQHPSPAFFAQKCERI